MAPHCQLSTDCGRGYAIREGFNAAEGEIICTVDADLSYTADHITKMVALLQKYPRLDCVVGSPYCPGGRTEGVPRLRLLISRLGNLVISRAMGGKIKTITGVLRAYRRDCIKSLELFSEGKELHLEILAKLFAAGYSVMEMPAVLRSRRKGRSKFRFRAIASSHLLFSLHEKPMLLFGLVGLALIGGGLIGGGYIVYLWQVAALNPNRPLMTLLVLLILTGIQILMFGFLGSGWCVCARRSSSYSARTRRWNESWKDGKNGLTTQSWKKRPEPLPPLQQLAKRNGIAKLLLVTNRLPVSVDDPASPFVLDFIRTLQSADIEVSAFTARLGEVDPAVIDFPPLPIRMGGKRGGRCRSYPSFGLQAGSGSIITSVKGVRRLLSISLVIATTTSLHCGRCRQGGSLRKHTE